MVLKRILHEAQLLLRSLLQFSKGKFSGLPSCVGKKKISADTFVSCEVIVVTKCKKFWFPDFVSKKKIFNCHSRFIQCDNKIGLPSCVGKKKFYTATFVFCEGLAVVFC